MKTSSVGALTGFLLATLATGTANAEDTDFILANNTQFSVFYVYFWPVTDDGPGPDRLGRKTLSSGKRLQFTPRDGGCHYNIRVGLENDKYEEWNNVNLCNLSSVTLNYDYLNRELWASTSTSRFPDFTRGEERYGVLYRSGR